MENVSKVLLKNGMYMPAIGFGTWQAAEKELEDALDIALESGYRHIDTAAAYENEKVIGKVLKKWFDSGKLKRSDLFIVTKLPPSGNRPESVEKWIKRSLSDLKLEYVDLYLVHTPFAFEDAGNDLHPLDEEGKVRLDVHTDHVKVWTEMEKQVECGRAKAIGLSNFNIGQIERIMKNSKIDVSNLQIELQIYFQQKDLVEFCKKHKIAVTAYSPLGSRGLVKLIGKTEEIPDVLKNPVILQMAKKYGKTPAQILLRFDVQNGIAAIPKSTNPMRIKENIQVFDFNIADEDMKALEKLDLGESGRICDFGFFKGVRCHPEFPF